MIKKVAGKINKREKQDTAAHVNYNNKTDNGTVRTRTVSEPRNRGFGAVYKDDEDF